MSLCLLKDCQGDWESGFTLPHNFSCHEDEGFYIASFDNKFEDHQWNLRCGSNQELSQLENCYNSFWSSSSYSDDLLDFTCRSKSVFTGISTHYDSFQKKMKYRFRCCDLPNKDIVKCVTNGFFTTSTDSAVNKAVVGAYSDFSKSEKDRRWILNICDVV